MCKYIPHAIETWSNTTIVFVLVIPGPKLTVVFKLDSVVVNSLAIHEEPQCQLRSEPEISALLAARDSNFILVASKTLASGEYPPSAGLGFWYCGRYIPHQPGEKPLSLTGFYNGAVFGDTRQRSEHACL
jgi:hypothetical protein